MTLNKKLGKSNDIKNGKRKRKTAKILVIKHLRTRRAGVVQKNQSRVRAELLREKIVKQAVEIAKKKTKKVA